MTKTLRDAKPAGLRRKLTSHERRVLDYIGFITLTPLRSKADIPAVIELAKMGLVVEHRTHYGHFIRTATGQDVADSTRARVATKMKDSYQSKRNPVTPRPRKDTENMDDPRGQFGEFLRDRIARLGGDEDAVAKEMGYDTGRTLRKWMEGVHGPAFHDLGRIAAALGFDDWYGLVAAVKKFHERKKK